MMRPFVVAACTALVAAPLFVLLPPACALAQAVPARGITITALAQQARVRSALGELVPPERSVSQVGVDVEAPTFWRPLRLRARVLRSAAGADDLHSMEAGVLVTGVFVGVEAAYSQRGSYSPRTGLAHARVAEFGRAGLRAQMAIGATGFSMHLRANAYVPTWRAADAEDDVEGWDGETGLSYTVPSLPLGATLGYRLERFRIFGVEQEVSALTFAIAFTVLGR